MRAVVQRASRAEVRVDGEVVGRIDRPGLVVLLGVTHDDGAVQVEQISRKIAELRILRDERSAADESAPILVISQFTPVSYTHLRAHETRHDLVCRLLL